MVKEWKQLFQEKGTKKQTRVVISISDKIDFKPKLIKRDREGHYLLNTKENKIHQEDITTLNIYAPNTMAPRFIKETLLQLKAHIETYMVIVRCYDRLLTCH